MIRVNLAPQADRFSRYAGQAVSCSPLYRVPLPDGRVYLTWFKLTVRDSGLRYAPVLSYFVAVKVTDTVRGDN